MDMISLKNVIKKKKIILLIFISIAVAACVIIFISLHSQKDRNQEMVMLKQGQQSGTLNKSETMTSNLQNVLQKQIDSLDEVSDSFVTINVGTGESQSSVSVIINLSSGKKLTSEQQSSIKTLIKNSVKNVSIDNIHLSISEKVNGQ